MIPSDPNDEAASSKYNIRINRADGTVIGDNLHVEQYFYSYDIPPNPPLDNEQKLSRSRMLAKVRSTWITGFLVQSLDGKGMIDLKLHEQADAVTNPWERVVQSPNQSGQSSSAKRPLQIFEAFEAAGEELLVLGEPGAGKTTLLLELACNLLDRAERDERYPIPVIFNLSSWTMRRQPLTNWLIEELTSKYQVPRKLGQVWVTKNQVALLLDGLDEVGAEHRAACIEAIGNYQQEHSLRIPIVICCRKADYFNEKKRLRLHTAVVVQPLTHAQIEMYLTSTSKQSEAVRVLMRNDPVLQELATSPLMLGILTQAYTGKSVEALQRVGIPTTRKQVFADYVERMLLRRGAETLYTPQQTRYWLIWLAQQLERHNQTEFYIERIQPDWLKDHLSRGLSYQILMRLSIWVTSGLIGGLVGGGLVIGWHLIQLPFSKISVIGWPGGLIVGVLIGLLVSLTLRIQDEIKPAEIVVWSWRSMWQKLMKTEALRSGVLFGLVFGLLTGAGLRLGPMFGLLTGSILGLIGGVVSKVIGDLIDDIHNMSARDAYKQLRKSSSIEDRAFVGLVGGLVIGPVIGVLGGLVMGVVGVWMYGFLEGLFLGLLGGLVLLLFAGIVGSVVIGLTHHAKIEKKSVDVIMSLWIGTWRRLARSESLRDMLIPAFAYGLFLGITSGQIEKELPLDLIIGLILALLSGLVFELISGLSAGLSSDLLDKQTLTKPNQGIHNSARNSITVGLVSGIVSGLLIGLFGGLFGASINSSLGLYVGLLCGPVSALIRGLSTGLSNGGVAYIQHRVLRVCLWRAGYAPWSYSRFLNYAAERVLLRRVGGGYIFVHRLLQDYFASLNAETLELLPSKQGDVCGCGYEETRSATRFCPNCGKLKQVTIEAPEQDISSRKTGPL